MMILTLAGLAMAPQVALGADRKLTPTDAASAIAVFQHVCLTPFPDPAAFKKAVANDPASFERIDDSRVAPAPGTPQAQEAEIWYAKRYSVRFVLAPDLPVSIPQPQCTVTAHLADAPDTAQIAATLSTALAAPGISVKAKPGAMRWDLNGPGGKWRVFLKTEHSSDGNFMSIVLINLRD